MLSTTSITSHRTRKAARASQGRALAAQNQREHRDPTPLVQQRRCPAVPARLAAPGGRRYSQVHPPLLDLRLMSLCQNCLQRTSVDRRIRAQRGHLVNGLSISHRVRARLASPDAFALVRCFRSARLLNPAFCNSQPSHIKRVANGLLAEGRLAVLDTLQSLLNKTRHRYPHSRNRPMVCRMGRPKREPTASGRRARR